MSVSVAVAMAIAVASTVAVVVTVALDVACIAFGFVLEHFHIISTSGQNIKVPNVLGNYGPRPWPKSHFTI